jgi:arabinose-5-phosphate isomerase
MRCKRGYYRWRPAPRVDKACTDIQQLPITDIMSAEPKMVNEEELVYEAEALMMERKITTLLVHNKAILLTGVYQLFNQA